MTDWTAIESPMERQARIAKAMRNHVILEQDYKNGSAECLVHRVYENEVEIQVEHEIRVIPKLDFFETYVMKDHASEDAPVPVDTEQPAAGFTSNHGLLYDR